MVTRAVRGVSTAVQAAIRGEAHELGNIVARQYHTALSASTWVPVVTVPIACRVRHVIFLPSAGSGNLNAANHWWGHLGVSRYDAAVDAGTGVLAAAPTGSDLIAKRQIINGSDSHMATQVPWDWGSVEWTETAAVLWPGDTLGVFWERVTDGTPSFPGNIAGTTAAPAIYTARLVPVEVT